MKQSIFTIIENKALTKDVYKMVLEGDTSAITASGQFVNILLEGRFLRRPISVCDWTDSTLTIVYKVVGKGTEAMSGMSAGQKLDILTGLGNGYDLSKAGGKPLVGLPGHPVAAYFITKLFVLPLLSRLMGRMQECYTTTAKVTESIGANHGRAQYQCCRLEWKDGQLYAYPIRGKAGLITTLAGADGYFCIDRDCEGLPRGAEIQVTISQGD